MELLDLRQGEAGGIGLLRGGARPNLAGKVVGQDLAALVQELQPLDQVLELADIPRL